MILPMGVLNETADKTVVQNLIQRGQLKAVVKCPEKMFLSTSIPVCVLVLSHEAGNSVVLIDAAKLATKEIREQRGQFGGASHTGRIYRKEFSVFSDEAISQIVRAINRKESSSFSKTVRIEDVTANDFNLNPLTYLPDEPETEQNKLEWIAERYNAIVRQKNACKLVINETLAKELGLDQELWEQQKKNSAQVADMIGKLGNVKLETEDYLTFTRSRELAIRFKSKDVMPEIFKQFVPMWVNRVALLNNLENEMLEQMRDYLLPKLISGELEIPEGEQKWKIEDQN